MKNIVKQTALFVSLLALDLASCKKDKDTDPVPAPTPIPNPEEVITTFQISFTDSASGTLKTYMFKDPDGPGGQSAYYGPTSAIQSDSVIQLNANTTYFASIRLLDETKNPADTISKEVKEEGAEHMFFYNNGSNTILNSGNPYTLQLNGNGVKITYIDLDAGTPLRGIGLETRWRTVSASPSKFPLNITLKHQPDSKDGTYSPGESDITVDFKLMVN
jgi:hypothetical protein